MADTQDQLLPCPHCGCAATDARTCKQSLQVAEQQGPEHISSPECWCEPELDYKDPETGAEVWVHRSMQ